MLQTITIPYQKRIRLLLFGVLGLGILIRLIGMYAQVHYFDLDYYVDWSSGVVEHGIFGAYDNIESLDYPPLFLFLLYPVGWFLKLDVVAASQNLIMIGLKFWQVAFDIAIIFALYGLFRKRNPRGALLAAVLWALCPAMILNSALWGQTDSIMLFGLLITFYLLQQHPNWAVIVYALCCLMKFQSAYFFPVVLLFLFYRFGIKKALIAIGCGAATGIAVFLPFIFESGFILPFEVYFGGLGKWRGASMNAFNLFGALGLNYIDDSVKVFGLVSASTLGNTLTVFSFVLVVVLFFKARNKCPYILSFVLMQSIFLFASRMHERYQIPVVLFSLVAFVVHRSGKMLVCFVLTAVMCSCNQILVFYHILAGRNACYSPWFDQITVVLSVVNLLVYGITVYLSLCQMNLFAPRCKQLPAS